MNKNELLEIKGGFSILGITSVIANLIYIISILKRFKKI
jgi:hypothetical protein